MDDQDVLAERFESHRGHLRAVAYRMLGSLADADDAVQEAWIRLARSDAGGIENLGGWLTRVLSRVCLDMLRSRVSRRDEPVGLEVPDPMMDGRDGGGPEHEALLADSVGLALLVVLDRLTPAERVAFVLHDLFGEPFEGIARVLERSTDAAKQLASRARRRVQGAPAIPPADLTRHRRLVEAFLAAARDGEMDALLAVLDPNVVRRADRVALPAGAPTEVRGARAVAEETRVFSERIRLARAALVDGMVGIVIAPRGHLLLAIGLGIEDERIAEIDVIADPKRLHRLALGALPTEDRSGSGRRQVR